MRNRISFVFTRENSGLPNSCCLRGGIINDLDNRNEFQKLTEGKNTEENFIQYC